MGLPHSETNGRSGIFGLWTLGSHRRVEYVRASVGLDDVWFRHLFGEFSGDNFLDIISDGLSWVGIELLVHGGAS